MFRRRPNVIFFLFLILFGLTLNTRICLANEKAFTISYPNYLDLDKIPKVKKFFQDCYAELGFTNIKFIKLPFNRSNTELENNSIDAEIGRTSIGIKNSPHRIHYVDFPIDTELKAYINYTQKSSPNIKKIVQLQTIQDSTVVVNNGHRGVSKKIDLTSSSLIYADDQDQIIKLLLSGRADYSISLLKLSSLNKEIFSDIIFKDSVYHVLAEKNKQLIPALSKIFKKKLTKSLKKQLQDELSQLTKPLQITTDKTLH